MAGIPSIGTELYLVKDGDETADLKIAHLTSAGAIKGTAEEIDVTDHDSPNGNKEYMAGAVDYGTFDFTGNVNDKTLVSKLYTLLNSKVKRSWYVKYKDGSRADFDGPLQSFGMDEQTTDGLITCSGSIRISGTPEYQATPTTE